jgi:hypothetical protein
MARTNDDIERYILSAGIPYDQVGVGTWVLHDPSWHGAQIVVQHTDPLVVYRVKLFDLPHMGAGDEAQLLRHLLHLNATEMLQGAYALEDNSVVAVEVMQSQSLDENEFLAAIDSLNLAITDHREEVLALLPKGAQTAQA